MPTQVQTDVSRISSAPRPATSTPGAVRADDHQVGGPLHVEGLLELDQRLVDDVVDGVVVLVAVVAPTNPEARFLLVPARVARNRALVLDRGMQLVLEEARVEFLAGERAPFGNRILDLVRGGPLGQRAARCSDVEVVLARIDRLDRSRWSRRRALRARAGTDVTQPRTPELAGRRRADALGLFSSDCGS